MFRKILGTLVWFSYLLFASGTALAFDPPSSPQLLIRLKPTASHDFGSLRMLSRRNDVPLSAKGFLSLTQTHLAEVKGDQDLPTLIQKLKEDPDVEWVEIDEKVKAHAQPNDQYFDLQWPLQSNNANIQAELAWNYTSSAQNIAIALIDSGVDLDHPEIAPNLWRNSNEIPDNGIDDDNNGYVDDVNGYDFLNNDNRPTDDFGHGTMVFGIIGALGNNGKGITGLAWNANVMSLKVLDSSGNSNISTAVEAIEYAIRNGARIINISWGYSPNGAPSQTLQDALQRAQDAGILVVTSAGNGIAGRGQDNDSDPATANYPSSFGNDNLIAVAATDSNDQLANFSNYGSQTVDLGAPGVSIYSTAPRNDFEYFTGTSAGAPHVSGAAALVWALNPNLSYSEVKRLLLETVDPGSSLQGKTLSGGRLNVGRALQSSPAAGGTLLLSPPALPSSAGFSATPEAGSGGCSLHGGSPVGSFSLLVWMGFFSAFYFFARFVFGNISAR